MPEEKRMPRYDVRNDGAGPYASFCCDKCGREFRSTPDVKGTVVKDIGKSAVSGLFRSVPLVRNVVDSRMDDPRDSYHLNAQELAAHWQQVQDRFHMCPTCQLVVCPSCWDAQSGFCSEDSPRRGEIAQAQAEQAAGVMKGIASIFGVDKVIQQATAAAQQAAKCPSCGTMAAPGTKFCPNCGKGMVQPAASVCPGCGAQVGAAKFCPNCGAKVAQAAPTTCSSCGTELKGAKFCPQCGTKAG
jgi:hypothetical protein